VHDVARVISRALVQPARALILHAVREEGARARARAEISIVGLRGSANKAVRTKQLRGLMNICHLDLFAVEQIERSSRACARARIAISRRDRSERAISQGGR